MADIPETSKWTDITAMFIMGFFALIFIGNWIAGMLLKKHEDKAEGRDDGDTGDTNG